MFARLGRLPKGHRVPEFVETLDELLAVFAFNQDSPQKTFRVGGGWHYMEAKKRGQTEGHVRLEWRISATVNYGRAGTPGSVPGTDGTHVTWNGGEFDRSPADRQGQPKTPEHLRAMAEVARRQCIGLTHRAPCLAHP